jgi:hypothetical protein
MKMTRWISAAVSAIATALLPACDLVVLPEIKPGITTAREVLARMGNPGYEFSNEDGSVTWEYTRQPSGVQCYMITLGPDRIVQKFEQVLNDANFLNARVGMTKEQIRRLFGQPARVQVFDNLREEVWEWKVEGMPPNQPTFFNVYFDTGSGLVKKAGKRFESLG